MSAECVGSLLRETMEGPAPAQGVAHSAVVAAAAAAAKQALTAGKNAGRCNNNNNNNNSNSNNNHYCVPISLLRLYREGKLGSPFAKRDDEAAAKRHACFLGRGVWGGGRGC